MTAITAAYLTQGGDTRVGTLTLLNTMLDYSEPGVLGNFTDESTVEKLIKKIAKSGTLEGTTMAGTFDILRANDLIFNYVVSNWLMGQDPPSFDILAWNADSTRMPAAMHAFYLRNFYVRNRLAAGTLEIAGRIIDLSAVKSPDLRRQRDQRPHRAVGVGVQDHVAGQRSCAVRAEQRRPHRGHRQPAEPEGVVPRPRRGAPAPGRPRRGGRPRSASRAPGGRTGRAGRRDRGRHDRPARTGNDRYPVLGDAPGRYVHS
jgi:polyhydroxyalkanoate synthase